MSNIDPQSFYKKANGGLLELPSDIFLEIMDQVVGEKGEFNVRIDFFGFKPSSVEEPSTRPGKCRLKSLVYPSREPPWTEFIPFEAHRGFADLLNLMRTCRLA